MKPCRQTFNFEIAKVSFLFLIRFLAEILKLILTSSWKYKGHVIVLPFLHLFQVLLDILLFFLCMSGIPSMSFIFLIQHHTNVTGFFQVQPQGFRSVSHYKSWMKGVAVCRDFVFTNFKSGIDVDELLVSHYDLILFKSYRGYGLWLLFGPITLPKFTNNLASGISELNQDFIKVFVTFANDLNAIKWISMVIERIRYIVHMCLKVFY